MKAEIMKDLPEFLDTLGLDEEPMGIHYVETPPPDCLSPAAMDPPDAEKERAGQVDWGAVWGGFSCAIGHVWRARRKKKAACFDREHFGCVGGLFFMGYIKPQTEAIIHYVSSGVPGRMEGERYIESPERLRAIFQIIDPPPAAARHCVFKPLSLFGPDENPEMVAFFARPETLCGLHQLATFVTNDPEAVASPWGAACTNLVTWPRHYAAQGRSRAVLGGWDCSARKFFKTDELTFTVPPGMFADMVARFRESFLTTKTWAEVRRKVARSRKAWGEEE